MNNFGFPTEFIEEVKSRSNIVSVISRSISLQKRGRYFWACCPFHFEKTPSFAVSEEEQVYHCYGCGEGGDVISFVQKFDRLTFMEAVKMLAEDAGLTLPTGVDGEKEMQKLRQKEKVLHALNSATQFYEDSLKSDEGKVARDYATSRHFTEDVLSHFKIGYSKDYNSLLSFFEKKGVAKQVLKDAGLVEMSQYGNLYDVFAGRMTFPIINSFGDTIGFTARILEKDAKQAKYRNSTQTIVFDKSKTIYNINTIKELKKTEDIKEVYILEGTIDVIAMYRAGIKNAVACLGTAITSSHALILKRYVDRVILCLDGDSAGQKATYKAIDVLREVGLEVRVVHLKDNLDPDEFLDKYGQEGLQSALKDTMDAIEYEINVIKDRYDLSDSYGKSQFIKEALPIVSKLPTSAEQDIYLRTVSDICHVSIDILRRDMRRDVPPKSAKNVEQETPSSSPDSLERATRFVLSALCFKRDYAMYLLDGDMTFKNSGYQRLFDFLRQCHKNGKTCTISTLYDYFDINNDERLKDIISLNFDNIDDERLYFAQCIDRMDRSRLALEQDELLASFRQERDMDKRRLIAKRLGDIAKELKKGDND